MASLSYAKVNKNTYQHLETSLTGLNLYRIYIFKKALATATYLAHTVTACYTNEKWQECEHVIQVLIKSIIFSVIMANLKCNNMS